MRTYYKNIHRDQRIENYIISNDNKDIETLFRKDALGMLQVKTPIFIMGEIGSGKTHLLNALHLEYGDMYPELKIVHIDTEQYVNDTISSYASRSEHLLYSEADILMIDDLQFLIGKIGTQNNFNILLRELKSKNVIIIITLESKKNLKYLSMSLRNFLCSGLLFELKPLDEVNQKRLDKLLEEKAKIIMDERMKKFWSLDTKPNPLLRKVVGQRETENLKLICPICNTTYQSEIDRNLCLQSHSELITLRWLAYELWIKKQEDADGIRCLDGDLRAHIDQIVERFQITEDEFNNFK